MWLIADYEAVALFSLRLSTATSSGGKTLLVPTPYAMKMALLSTACHTLGVARANFLWDEIRALQVALQPPSTAVVSNLFQKVLKPYKNPPKPGVPDFGPFQRTIAYREYVQWLGTLRLALECNEAQTAWLSVLLLNINYFGKRGSFLQLRRAPATLDKLPDGFTVLTQDQQQFAMGGTLQVLDDCGESLTFDKASIYTHDSKNKVKLGKDRVLRNIVLPYRLQRSSKSYSWYERL
jgi:hypothetical protein